MSAPQIDYRPFERVRDDWTRALRVLLRTATDEEVDAFARLTNELMDALVNRAIAGTVAASKVVENDALHTQMKQQLDHLQHTVDLISLAVIGPGDG